MSGYEFDPGDKKGSLRARFDFYCKEVIYHAAHNLVRKQTHYLLFQFGGEDIDPDELVREDDYGRLFAAKMSVRGKEVIVRHPLSIEEEQAFIDFLDDPKLKQPTQRLTVHHLSEAGASIGDTHIGIIMFILIKANDFSKY